MFRNIAVILFLFGFNMGFAQDVVINEIMSSNVNTIADDFGEYPDWVEIYNNSSQDINIGQWFLSDDENDLDKWMFPDTTILPGHFLLVFCSGRDTLSGYLHSRFKISSLGEEIILCNENEIIVDEFEPVELANDISFGRMTDGNPEKNRFYVSSPGYSNSNNFELAEISFSHDAGFYDNIDLELQSASTEGQIYYTLNSNEPRPGSPGTFLYESILSLSGAQNSPAIYSYIPTTPQDNSGYYEWQMPQGDIEKHMVVRARVFSGDQALCNVYSNTYFLGDDIMERFSLPVLSIVADSISLFDYDTGIYVPGKYHIEGVVKSGNYSERGDAWERKGTIEYFSETGELLLEQDLGIRLHGNITRAAPQKGIQFFPRSSYDGNGRMGFPFFEELPFDSYKRIIARSVYSAHNYSIVRDEIAQDIAKNLNVHYQQWQPVVVFVNGEYWGIQVLREKQNEYYLEQHFNIDPDNVDVIGLWGVAENGDLEEHDNLEYFIENNDLSVPENYEEIKEMIDVPAYIDYYIAEIFFTNSDWPGNNYLKWREKGEGNKWGWFLFDLDASMKYVGFNGLTHAAGDSLNGFNPEWSTRLFKAMLQSEEFEDRFVSRFVYVMNNDFNPEVSVPVVDKWEALIENEIGNTSSRWGMPYNIWAWRDSLESIRQFLTYRSCYQKSHLEEYFGIDSLDVPCVNLIPDDTVEVLMKVFPNPARNTVYLSSSQRFQSWEIYDMAGVFVKRGKGRDHLHDEIDISDMSRGIYTLIVHTGGNYSALKIIKIN